MTAPASGWMIRGEGGKVIMSDGTNVAVSRRKKQELMDGLARM